MSAYNNLIQGTYNLLTSGVRTTTQVFTKQQIMDANSVSGINQEASGIIAYLNVTAVPGTDTVQLVLEEIDPLSGVVAQIAATTATTVTGLVRLKLKQAITAIAPSVTQVQAQDTLPANWRLRVVHSAASNFTYSLSAVLYN
jgi:hypothetical protein